MGSIISASCSCGYQSGEMFLGSGMIYVPNCCHFPFYCKDCSTLFVGNLLEKELLCTNCGSKKTISYQQEKAYKKKGTEIIFSYYLGDEFDYEAQLTDGKYICPACRKYYLTFSDLGCWD